MDESTDFMEEETRKVVVQEICSIVYGKTLMDISGIKEDIFGYSSTI